MMGIEAVSPTSRRIILRAFSTLAGGVPLSVSEASFTQTLGSPSHFKPRSRAVQEIQPRARRI